ncbi:MAG: NUDIX hydrolase [Anaerolineae bacterium]|nr:NUDIX hydrolase [Anaerolineae bacterium]
MDEREKGAARSRWLEWAQRLQAIAQSGLTYTRNPFEIERYEAVREIAAEIVATHSDLDIDQVRDLFAAEQGYATPKVDVRGVVFHEDRILLVKELRDGRWTLPGGWADVNDSPAEATVREVYEESGYHSRAVKLLACYDRNRHGHPPYGFHIYKLFFLCELTGGAPAESIETGGARFFGEDEIPELSLPRVTPSQIARFFAHHRHPEWPTDFD